MTWRGIFNLAAGLFLWLAPAFAQEKQLTGTDRPGIGDGASIVTPGGVQVELGYTFSDVEDVQVQSFGELNFRFGLLQRLELRASLNSYVDVDIPDVSGLTDSAVNLKLGLLPADAGAELALLAGVSLDTGDDELTSGETDPNVALSLGWSISDALSHSAYVGYQDGDNSLTTVSTSLGFSVGPAGVSVGYGGFYPDRGSDQHWLEANAVFAIGALSQFDLNAGVGVGDDNSGFFIGAGFAHRF